MNARAHVIRWMRRPRVPALLLVPMLLLGAPPGVAHAAGGRISGQVLDEHGVPVASARVSIQGADEAEVARAECDEFGLYETEPFPAGKYLVLAEESRKVWLSQLGLLPRWHGDAASSALATPVAVVAGRKTAGIDVHLPRGGTISGRVTGVGGAPVAAASVEVIPWEEGNGGSGRTGEDGTYMIDSLEPGSYRIRFGPPGASSFLTAWHPGAAHADGAALITIGLGEDVAGIDGALPLGGSISGRVTGVGGTPLADVSVLASAVGWLDHEGFHETVTDADGDYRLQGLATTSYHVRFSPWGYNELWYPAQYSRESAVPVAVVAGGETPGIHGRIGSSITGRVTTSDGTPVAGMEVNVVEPVLYSWRGGSVTDATGTYLIAGLAPGTFHVCFPFLWDDLVGYSPQCYDGHAGVEGSDPVTVLFDQTTTGIDAVIERGGTIAGKLTGAGGIAIAPGGGYVVVYDTAGEYVAQSSVDDEGHYQVRGLAAGSYRLRGREEGNGPYVPTWYPGAPDPAAATEVVSGPGLDVSGIDWELPVGGVITGRVTNTGGSAVASVEVDVRRTDVTTGDRVSGGLTDGTGRYRVQGLPAGEYTLNFLPPPGPLLERWYDGKRTAAKADHLSISLGQTRSGIDARLPRGGSVTGLVTGEGGAPLAGVLVVVESADGAHERFIAYTDRRGRYNVSRMPRGAYQVQFAPGAESGYLGQWYRQRAQLKDADKVVVAEGGAVRGIDARLARGGSVVGRMTDARGVVLVSGWVELYRGQNEVGWSQADSQGFYSIGPLKPGVKYRLRFVPPGGFLPQWHLRRDSAEDADPIVISKAGGKKTVNVRLDRGGAITGRITADGDPFQDVEVAAYTAEGGRLWSTSSVDAGGRYRLGGLSSGSYRVEFKPWEGVPFLPQWYDGRPTPEEADLVSVTAGAVTPGIDAVLAPAP